MTIGKTIRVVRFVRSSRVAKVVGKVNWYWPIHVLDPRYLFQRCSFRSNGSTSNSGDGKKNSSASGSPNTNASDGGGHEGALMRQRSWGGLGLATLAAVKAQNLAREEQKKQEHSWWGKCKRFLWSMGILRNDKAEWQRQLAATKIQRAWRKAKNYGEPQTDDTDFAWKGSMRSSSKTARAFRKHSIMKNYSSINKNFKQSRQRLEGNNHASDRGAGVTLYPNVTAGGNGTTANMGKNNQRDRNESQVGSAMRELTGQRVVSS